MSGRARGGTPAPGVGRRAVRGRLAGAALVAVVFLAAGCGGSGPAPGGSGGTWPAGRTFLSTAVTDHGAARPLVPGTRIAISFTADGQVAADAGCNHMGGAAKLEDGTLVIAELAMTEMGCDPARAAQDSWLAAVLTGKPRFELAGDLLTLTTSDTVIQLRDRTVVEPDLPVAGTVWVADTIIDGDTASSVPQGALATLEITPSGSFRAMTSCSGGQLTGSASIHDGRISFGAVRADACTDGGNALDAAVRATLRGEVRYTVEASTLTLLAADGSGVRFTARR